MAQQDVHVNRDTLQSILASEGIDFLLSCEGQVPVKSIEGKTTCLFFSANWCRPCRNFAPSLVHLYNSVKASGKNLEIVFVSFDRDELSFSNHLSKMPWVALPFDVNTRKRLCGRFHVERIPSLIPLASDGRGVGEDAVQLVEDYRVEAYPFGVERRMELEAMDEAKRQGGKLEDLLGSRDRDFLISRDDTKVLITELVGKTVGLYFGAHWCPPCRTFTAMLMEAYSELKSATSFQVVFVSTDRSDDEFRASLEEMPWLAIPYSGTTRHDLSRIFNAKSIPALVFLGTDGRVIRTDGRAVIASYGVMAFPFTESRTAELEAALRKEGEALPGHVRDPRHGHVLKLDVAKAYVCDVCRSRGRYWVFSCDQCNFDLHPSCVSEIQQ